MKYLVSYKYIRSNWEELHGDSMCIVKGNKLTEKSVMEMHEEIKNKNGYKKVVINNIIKLDE